MKRLPHMLGVLLVLFLSLGLPFLRSETFAAMRSGTDAVTSASVVLDRPSGEYVVFLNRVSHEASGTLSIWEEFFRGEDIGIVFEDLTCFTAKGDAGGIEFAESLKSRLPENQMMVRTLDGTLALSRAEAGRFDVLILSREAAELYQAETLFDRAEITVIPVSEEAP